MGEVLDSFVWGELGEFKGDGVVEDCGEGSVGLSAKVEVGLDGSFGRDDFWNDDRTDEVSAKFRGGGEVALEETTEFLTLGPTGSSFC